MKLLIRIIITSVLVLLISHFMTGVVVANFTTSLIVAVVLGLLNIFIKPILVLLTLPVTVVTLGLFLLVINAVIILICTQIVGGFKVDTFFTALLFSVVLSLSQSILYAIVGKDKK
jgi:putative membrane protein